MIGSPALGCGRSQPLLILVPSGISLQPSPPDEVGMYPSFTTVIVLSHRDWLQVHPASWGFFIGRLDRLPQRGQVGVAMRYTMVGSKGQVADLKQVNTKFLAPEHSPSRGEGNSVRMWAP